MIRRLFFLFLLASPSVVAQSATDYYHTAAQLYIGEQNQPAEAAAEAGLALEPTHAKLQALLEKIREQQQQQGGGQQQEQENADEQQSGEGEQQQDSNAEDGDKQQDEAESEGEQEGDQHQPGEQQPPEDQTPPDEREGTTGTEGDTPPDDPQDGGGTATPFEVKPGEMSRDEAERILRAIQTDELELLRDVQRRRARPRYVEKDW